jgi:hypothetical protein
MLQHFKKGAIKTLKEWALAINNNLTSVKKQNFQ